MPVARRARWPVAGALVWLGAIYGSLAVAVLDIQHALGIGPGATGALLAAGFGAGAAAALLGGRWVETAGIVRAVLAGIVVVAITAAAVAVAEGTAALASAIVVLLATAGLLNAAANAGAAILTDGRAIPFLRYHAWFSAGAFSGAAGTAIIESVGTSWRLTWCVLAAAGLVIAGVGALLLAGSLHGGVDRLSSTPPRGSVITVLRSPHIRRTALLAFGAVVAAGAVDTWGVRYLRVDRATTVLGGAGAYAAGQAVATLARAQVGLSERRARFLTVPVAAWTLGGGLLLEAAAPSTWLSAIGLGVAAVAAAMLVPLVVLRGSIGDRPAAGVAAVGAVGQVGFVAGPILVGSVTTWTGSGMGLVVAAAFAVATAAGSSRRRPVDERITVGERERGMRSESADDEV